MRLAIFFALTLSASAQAASTYTDAGAWLEAIGGGISGLETFDGLAPGTVVTDQYAPIFTAPDGNDRISPAGVLDGAGRIRLEVGGRWSAVGVVTSQPMQVFVGEDFSSASTYVGITCTPPFCAVYVPQGFAVVSFRNPVSEDQTSIDGIYWLDAPPAVTGRVACFSDEQGPEVGQAYAVIFTEDGIETLPTVTLDAGGCMDVDVPEGAPYAVLRFP